MQLKYLIFPSHIRENWIEIRRIWLIKPAQNTYNNPTWKRDAQIFTMCHKISHFLLPLAPLILPPHIRERAVPCNKYYV